MALTPSTMLPLGTKIPAFSLPDTNGKTITNADFADASAYLIMFICNHCPYVKHVADTIADLTARYMDRGVAVVGVMSNDVTKYQDDRLELMKEEALKRGYKFPYVHDHEQTVAKAFQAACTPEFYVFDRAQKLVYRGQLDASRPGNGIAPSGSDVASALDAVLDGKPVSSDQKPSIGCNIKWRPGHEPSYFGR
jgi:peroxiredoxin